MTTCIHCGCFIESDLGNEPPAAHSGNAGTSNDPRSPGDWDNICDYCNYARELRGGPNAIPTYHGDHQEWER